MGTCFFIISDHVPVSHAMLWFQCIEFQGVGAGKFQVALEIRFTSLELFGLRHFVLKKMR